MVRYKAALIFGLLLCVSLCAGELKLSGHETPVYVGLSAIITCEWIGSGNIAELEWYLVGGDGSGLGRKYEGVDDTTLLITGHIVDISWNGRKYMCQANLTSGELVNRTFCLWVKEAKNEIMITPSYVPCGDNHNLMAGDNHTLTCTVNSEFPANLKWVRIIDEVQVELENTPNITVSEQIVSDEITKRSITFKPLLTSHAGVYKCVSFLNNYGPKLLSTKEKEYIVKVKFPPPTVKLISDNEAVTSKPFYLTALINVHPEVDIDIDSSWYGHNSLNASRVTISYSNKSSVVQFAPLISSDEGTYSFSTRVRDLDSEYLCPSSLVKDSIDISPNLFVTIDVEYTPPPRFNRPYPPNYKVNTDVTFTCQAEGASRDVKYQWSSTAERELPVDSNSQTLIMLNSSDTGNYTCTAIDAKNNRGSATTEVEVIGLNVFVKVEYNRPADCNFLSPSPPYFRPATFVNLTCKVLGASGEFNYLWKSTNPNSFVLNSRSTFWGGAILTSDDAGNHTCYVKDNDENEGSDTIEMEMKGGGIFVLKSRSHNNMPLVNNDMIIFDSRSRIIDFICYTNSSVSDDWYIILPNNTQYNKSQQVRRTPPSGIQFQNNNTRLRVNTGIYTCRLRDLNGKNIDFNLGVYTSTRAPYIYYSGYTDQSKNESNILLGVIEIKTRYAPPTNVTCKRDGEIVVSYPCTKKDGYEVMQVITNRRYSYYTTYVQIRNACDLVGKNEYTCTVENSAGRRSRNIRTSMEVKADLSLENSTEPVYTDTFILKCTVTITPPEAAGYLFQQALIEWVGPDGNVLTTTDGITVGNQEADQNFRKLKFSSLHYNHEGQYTCRTKCVESTPQIFTIKVIERTILQLKFGPLPHCSNWYKEKQISVHVEQDLRKAIEGILLKDCDNSCTLHRRLLTEQRFSCQTSTSCVTFRATLIGSQDTMKLSNMLSALTNWLAYDGTFLYNYNSRIRLRADRECPLTISSFCDAECEGRECLFQQNTTILSVNSHPHTHLFG